MRSPDHHDTISNILVLSGLGLDILLTNDSEPDKLIKDDDDTRKDVSDFLELETREDSEEEQEEGSLVCTVCFAKFKTRSGWKNHKVIHQKFRTKEFSCHVCFRRFYWDKDCRRHVKNIHGIDHFDPDESRSVSDTAQPSQEQVEEDQESPFSRISKSKLNYLDPVLKANFLKMKLQMVKCKKNRLNNANRRVRFKQTDCDSDDILDLSTHNKTDAFNESRDKATKTDVHLNNNLDMIHDSRDGRDKNLKESLFDKTNNTPNKTQNLKDLKEVENNDSNKKKNEFQCQECVKKFTSNKSLKAHMKTCSAPPDSPYNCTLCDRRFIDFEMLQKHWKVNHRRQQIV